MKQSLEKTGDLKPTLSAFRRRASFLNQMFYVDNLLKDNIKSIIAHIKNIHWKRSNSKYT